MQARIPNPISRLRTTAPRRGYRQTERTDVPVAESSTPVETRVREAGGP